MNKWRKYLALALASIMMFSLVACGSSKSGDSDDSIDAGSSETTGVYGEITIGLILPIGGLGDNAIADGSYNGVKKASKQLGFEVDYSEPVSEQDREAMIIEYSESGDYDLIIAVGAEVASIVESLQPNYPDQKYLVHDASGEIENTVCEYFSKEELGFVAGCFMELMDSYGELTIGGKTVTWEPSNKVGLVVGAEYPTTIPPMSGGAAGAKYINGDSDYMYGIVGNWTDQAKNKEIALSMYDEGCHFILHNSGAGSAGILAAAQERGLFMIGYDSNGLYAENPNVPAFSDKNNVDTMVRVLTAFCEDPNSLPWGSSEENNFSNGGTAFYYNETAEIPQEVKDTMDAVIEKLSSGEIEIPTTWEDVEAFSFHYE